MPPSKAQKLAEVAPRSPPRGPKRGARVLKHPLQSPIPVKLVAPASKPVPATSGESKSDDSGDDGPMLTGRKGILGAKARPSMPEPSSLFNSPPAVFVGLREHVASPSKTRDLLPTETGSGSPAVLARSPLRAAAAPLQGGSSSPSFVKLQAERARALRPSENGQGQTAKSRRLLALLTPPTIAGFCKAASQGL